MYSFRPENPKLAKYFGNTDSDKITIDTCNFDEALVALSNCLKDICSKLGYNPTRTSYDWASCDTCRSGPIYVTVLLKDGLRIVEKFVTVPNTNRTLA